MVPQQDSVSNLKDTVRLAMPLVVGVVLLENNMFREAIDEKNHVSLRWFLEMVARIPVLFAVVSDLRSMLVVDPFAI